MSESYSQEFYNPCTEMMMRIHGGFEGEAPPGCDSNGGMLAEMVDNYRSAWRKSAAQVLEEQIQASSYGRSWPQKDPLSLNQALPLMNLIHVKPSSSPPPRTAPFTLATDLSPESNLIHQGFQVVSPLMTMEAQGLSLSLKMEEFQTGNGSGINNYYNTNQELLPLGTHFLEEPRREILSRQEVNIMLVRHPRYLKAAQELLQEFCCLGRELHFKNGGRVKKRGGSGNPSSGDMETGNSPVERPPLSAAERSGADAGDGELVRFGDGMQRGGAVHGVCADGDVETFPVPEGRYSESAPGDLQSSGGEARRCRELWVDERGNAQAETSRPEAEATESFEPDGNAAGF